MDIFKNWLSERLRISEDQLDQRLGTVFVLSVILIALGAAFWAVPPALMVLRAIVSWLLIKGAWVIMAAKGLLIAIVGVFGSLLISHHIWRRVVIAVDNWWGKKVDFDSSNFWFAVLFALANGICWPPFVRWLVSLPSWVNNLYVSEGLVFDGYSVGWFVGAFVLGLIGYFWREIVAA